MSIKLNHGNSFINKIKDYVLQQTKHRTRCLFLIVSGLFLFSNQAYACSCPPIGNHDKTIENSYRNSDLVFIGEVREISNLFVLDVIEVFKGDLQVSRSYNFAQNNYYGCSFQFKKEGKVLVYGSLEDNGIRASMCTPTRYLACPLFYPPKPPPPNSNSVLSDEDYAKMRDEREILEMQRLEYEIKKLKKKTYEQL